MNCLIQIMSEKSLNFYKKKNFEWIGCIAILVIQNIIIFWDHYFNRAGFKWDFEYPF